MKFPTLKPFADDKKLAIELLKLAKENLREGKSHYLCTAVTDAAERFPYEDFAHEIWVRLTTRELIEWVRKMVGENLAYVTQTQEYLDSKKEGLDYELHDKAPKLAIVQHENTYRSAWADHLIAYLETQA